MKKSIILGASVAGLIALFPGSASADSYSHSSDWQSDDSSSQNWNESDWDSERCERIANRIDRVNNRFDQTNDWRLAREQRLIDRSNEADCPASGSIVDTLVENGNFTTLVAAVQAAGLGDALSGGEGAPAELTVFAPTDQAFAALPAGTVEGLLADIPTLTKVLTNHVVNGKVDAETAATLSQATALSGNQLNISSDEDGNLYINNSKVVLSDIYTTNGVIHVIDAVLVP